MPKKCCLPNCKVQRDDPEGLDLSFYIIPADENLRKKWSENIKQHYNVEFKKYSYVCSRHFEKHCFEPSFSTKMNRKLKKGSCPTIFVDFKSLKQKDTQDKENVIDNKNCNDFVSHSLSNGSINTAVGSNVIDVSTHNEEVDVLECDSDNRDTDTISSITISNLISSHEVLLAESETPESTSMSVANNVQENTDNSSSNLCSSQISLQLSSSEETPLPDIESSCFIDPNVQKSKDSSISEVTTSKVTTITSTSIHKKSLSNIDVDSIPFTMENLPIIRRILLNGKNEVIALKRKLQARRMKVYRYKKRVTDVKSLSSHMKDQKFLTDKVSKLLEVSINVNKCK
ncbi:hypothetical protein TSAR_001121 [Trichomalopsis sarcophagae]|uniref:THAP-type domain-containing protein n=1 Tax=Trichomalopsis sarcophagae TaxID=543379 RepID=A0A232ESQ9_9HYME|nr:hypothetical protein TSAR_001121 [Trichomalopsis sarcophagae]